jgi:hypothetical protein
VKSEEKKESITKKQDARKKEIKIFMHLPADKGRFVAIKKETRARNQD